MQPNLLMAIILPFLMNCSPADSPHSLRSTENPFARVGDITLPDGYSRITVETGSFSEWLRGLPLKKNKTVYYYNGREKPNQSAQFAVLDITVGDKDLQQCADAVMRLRAEYLFGQKRYSEISFSDNAGTEYNAPSDGSRRAFDRYLQKVFSWCGTISLEKQLKPVRDLSAIVPGDVFIKGGSPGHAALVMDVGVNNKGEKIFLLANSYMPAQDIHLVVNPADHSLSPWFSAQNLSVVQLPEWRFIPQQLRRW